MLVGIDSHFISDVGLEYSSYCLNDYSCVRWRTGTVVKVLAVQVWECELNPQDLCKSQVWQHIWNSSAEVWEVRVS